MNAVDNILTYVPLIYFITVSIVMAMMNHVWHPKHKPFTDLSVLLVNIFVYSYVTNKSKNNVLVKNILVYHLWYSVTFSVFAFTFNSIHDTMFKEFKIESLDVKVFMGLIYVMLVFIFSYAYHSLYALFSLHIVFMFINVERNWVVNLVFFDIVLVIYIVNMFSNLKRHQIDDVRISRKPLLISYQYLTMHYYVIPVAILHILLEIYFRDFVSDAEMHSDIIDVVDTVYKDSAR